MHGPLRRLMLTTIGTVALAGLAAAPAMAATGVITEPASAITATTVVLHGVVKTDGTGT